MDHEPRPPKTLLGASIMPHLARAQLKIMERNEGQSARLIECAVFLTELQAAVGGADPSMESQDLADLAGRFFAPAPTPQWPPHRPWETFYAWRVEHGHLTQTEADQAIGELCPGERN